MAPGHAPAPAFAASSPAVEAFDIAHLRSRIESRLFGTPGETFQIGSYVVSSKVGAGGMGVVYAAHDRALNRKIAIKILHSHLSQGATSKQLRREAQALAKLSHPNVVHVYEVGEHQGQLYFAMEFLPGQTLSKIKSEDFHNWHERLAPWLAAGQGLLAAHQAGLVHGDFKPDNVMVLPNGAVKVFDFGLAGSSIARDHRAATPGQAPAKRAADHNGNARENDSTHSAGIATSGPEAGPVAGIPPQQNPTLMRERDSIAGTPAYIAPEQCRGFSGDVRSDQFSFCIALWEYACASYPFPERSTRDLRRAAELGPLLSPPRNSMPNWLRRILVKGLASDPQQRYASMAELLRDIEKGLQRTQRLQRRLIFATAATGMAALLAIVINRPDPCADVESIWSSTRDSVHQSLQDLSKQRKEKSTGHVFFEDAFQAFDRYIEKARNRHQNACQEALRNRELNSSPYIRQSSCYEFASRSLQNSVAKIHAPLALDIRIETWLSSAESTLDGCDRPHDIKSRSPEEQKARRDLEQELAQVRSDVALLNYPKALPVIESIIVRARELDFQEILAHALLLRAGTSHGRNDNDERLEAAKEAYRIAETLGDSDLRLDAEIWRATILRMRGQEKQAMERLRDVYGLAMHGQIRLDRRAKYLERACVLEGRNGYFCKALQLCQQGIELVDASPSMPVRKANLYRVAAHVYFQLGELDRSIELAEQILRESEAQFGAKSTLMAYPNMLLARMRAEKLRILGGDRSELDPIIQRAKRATSQLIEVYGANTPGAAGAQFNVAELLRRRGHYQASEALLDELSKHFPEDPQDYTTKVAYGRVMMATGRKQEGQKRLLEAIQVMDKIVKTERFAQKSTVFSERGEALWELAQASPEPTATRYAKQALEVYAELEKQQKQQWELSECANLPGQRLFLYQSEKKQLQAWLAERNAL